MSMGPSKPNNEKEPSLVTTRFVVNSVVRGVGQNPAEWLFYLSLAILMIGLPLRVVFPLPYYGVVILLGIVCVFAKGGEEVTKKKKV